MALVKSFGLLILLGLLALLTVHFTHSVYLPQRTVLQEQTDELQSLQRELQTLKSQEDVEHAALEQRLEAIEALLGVLKSAQPKDVKEAADAAANKAVATANKTKTKAAKRSKALWREDHTCGPTGSLPNGEPAQCNPKSDAPCCSPSGWCGGTVEHCSCPSCIDYRTAAKPPEPYNLESPKRIALVVPFRDRGTHLEKFRERIQSHIASWERKGIRHHWKVYVVEQFDEQLFNRGYLFNVGFQYATVDEKNTGQKFDCVVMHDIDILPTPVVDYGWCLYPNQLSGEIECWGWGVPYPDNVGGVVSLSPSHWRGINGFSNEYDGWGGEDDDLYLRLKANNLLKGGCHTWCKDKNKPTVPMVRRPPLGEGKMTCLHDGDHTPRQRAPQDAPMWQRLNSMKAGSKRWLNDGLSSLKFFSAGDALETQACASACEAPEDPEKRVRLFSEHWSRVSSRAISHPERVEVVRLPGSHGCGNISRPLPLLPAGLLQMRQLLPKLFSGHCDMGQVEDWAHRANFILVDLSTGQALLVGAGVQLVLPDSSRPSMKEDGSEVEATKGTEHLLQAQRLSRWLRKLPDTHRGWIVVVDEALSVWQQRFVQTGRRFPLLSPACISKVAATNGFKYRITPGTKWCGDGGWSHLDFFPVLRSGTNIPADKRVPICISYNRNGYYYRFENSVRGCVGKHKPTGTQWTHAQTIYTSRDANGTAYCVGMKEAGEHTRWTVQKTQICADGFRHSFGFRAMHNDYTSPLVPCCILVALKSELGSKETPLQRFAAGKECETSTEWRVVYKLVLLSRPIDAEHHRVCIAAGSSAKVTSEANSESDARDPHQVFRVFYDAACDKKSLVTFEGERKFFWDVGTENLFLPHTATGIHLCLCHVVMSKLKSSQESVRTDLPFYTWVESKCPKGAKKELCFNTMGPADVLNAVQLVDEVV